MLAQNTKHQNNRLPVSIPLRSFRFIECLGQINPVVSKIEPGRFVERISGVFRVEPAVFRSSAAFFGELAAHGRY